MTQKVINLQQIYNSLQFTIYIYKRFDIDKLYQYMVHSTAAIKSKCSSDVFDKKRCLPLSFLL